MQEAHASTLPVQNVYQFDVRVNNNNGGGDLNHHRHRKNRPTSSTGPSFGVNLGTQKRRPQSAKREIVTALRSHKNAYGNVGSPLIFNKKAKQMQSTQ